MIAGRTMDFPVNADWRPVLMNSETYPTVLEGTRPIKYPYIGGGRMVDDRELLVADGVNVAGLSCSELMFPLKASYNSEPATGKLNLTPQDFLFWVLAEHDTIASLKKGLDSVHLVGKEWLAGNEVFSFHWIIQDKSGATLIVEPINHQLHVIDSRLGVLTNSPTYEQHVNNLGDYLGIQPTDPNFDEQVIAKSRQLVTNHQVPEATNTPTTRFLHAAIKKLGTPRSDNAEVAVNFVFETLHEVAIPFHPSMNDHPNFNYTHYISAWDNTSLSYYFQDRNASDWSSFSLSELLKTEPKQNRFLA